MIGVRLAERRSLQLDLAPTNDAKTQQSQRIDVANRIPSNICINAILVTQLVAYPRGRLGLKWHAILPTTDLTIPLEKNRRRPRIMPKQYVSSNSNYSPSSAYS